MSRASCDLAIIGGGIAGLWLLNLARRQGYSAVLIERDRLGGGQTLASQGMIHGGIKYTLNGALSAASETIASMPGRWLRCLSGESESDPDLRQVRLLSNEYFLFSDGRLSSKLTAFFGSKAIQGRVENLQAAELPPFFRHEAFRGLVYRLQDVVIDTTSLVKTLAAAGQPAIYTGNYTLNTGDPQNPVIELEDGQSIGPKQLILAAGEGNGELITRLGLPLTMQLRPLNQVVVKSAQLPGLYAHAVSLKSADKPRLTITSHESDKGRTAWYLGGQLAESGVERSDPDQISMARRELAVFFPWLDLEDAEFSTLRINRAEAGQGNGQRPDTPFAEQFGNIIVCWPTKLTLAPLLGDEVMRLLGSPGNMAPISFKEAPQIGNYPWEEPDA